MRWIALPVVCVLAVLVISHHVRADAAEARLAAIASEIAHRPVEVHCQGTLGAALDVTPEAGSVQFDARGRPADHTDLKRRVCSSLARFDELDFSCLSAPSGCRRAAVDAAIAAHTLAHESWHLAGEISEAATECFALQTTAYVAERLGASPDHARAIATFALDELYPQLPAEYHSTACRDGSPLDLDPRSSHWP